MAYQIPGSVTSAADQAKATANAAVAAATPSYTDMIGQIKSGAIFKDTESQLGALGNIGVDSGTLGNITSIISDAKSSMSINMSIANAALAQKAKEAASAGKELTQDAINAAMGPLGVLKSLQSTMSSAMGSLQSAVSTAANVLGANTSGSNPTDVVNNAASALASFKSLIPPQTIADPVTGQQITNLAYTAFAAANPDKMAAVSSINNSTASVGSGLLSSLSSMALNAATSKADVIANLKADALLSKLTRPVPVDMAKITSDNINTNLIDKYAAVKVQEASVGTVVTTTKEEVRPGTATIISEFPPAALNNSDRKRIWSYELNQFAAERNKAEAAWASFYGASTSDTPESSQAKFDIWVKVLFVKYGGADGETIFDQHRAIKRAKPDPNDRTPEETAINKTYSSYRKLVVASPEFMKQEELKSEYNKMYDGYTQMYSVWIGSNDRYALEKWILDKITSYKS